MRDRRASGVQDVMEPTDYLEEEYKKVLKPNAFLLCTSAVFQDPKIPSEGRIKGSLFLEEMFFSVVMARFAVLSDKEKEMFEEKHGLESNDGILRLAKILSSDDGAHCEMLERNKQLCLYATGIRIPYGGVESVSSKGREVRIRLKDSSLFRFTVSTNGLPLLDELKARWKPRGKRQLPQRLTTNDDDDRSLGRERYLKDLLRLGFEDRRAASGPIQNTAACSGTVQLVISAANEEYAMCSTYPRFLVVPSTLFESDLKIAGTLRVKERFPVVTWVTPPDRRRACLVRCSQPVFKSFFSRAEENDEKLCKEYGTYSDRGVLHVLDCRSKINAMANVMRGGGYENESIYNCKVEFCNIQNIHKVKAAYEGLLDALHDDECENHGTEWLSYLRLIIRAAAKGAAKIHEGYSVMIHCSDGWDRTSQLNSLVEILLDREYRTCDGLCSLIEKEWCQFGHNFEDREGIYSGADSEKEGPIFLQFLDALRTIMHQFPACFEYDERFLIEILEAFHSRTYYNFIFNSEQERDKSRVNTEGSGFPDAWSEVLSANRKSCCLNSLFDPNNRMDYLEIGETSLSSISVWHVYFFRQERRVKEAFRALKVPWPRGFVTGRVMAIGEALEETIRERDELRDTVVAKDEKIRQLETQLKGLKSTVCNLKEQNASLRDLVQSDLVHRDLSKVSLGALREADSNGHGTSDGSSCTSFSESAVLGLGKSHIPIERKTGWIVPCYLDEMLKEKRAKQQERGIAELVRF